MANDLNSFNGIGRLTRDAETRYTAGGMAICSMSIASGYRKKNGDAWEDEVSFFDVTLFGKTAETLGKYLVKGKQVAISGELRQERWEKDGQTRSKVTIHANNVQLLGDSKQSASAPASEPASDGFTDSIPF